MMTPIGHVTPGPRAAAELVELVRETVAANARREVLYLRLGGLNAALRGGGAAARRLLREALDPVLASARIRVFDLPNGDVVAVAPPPALQLELARNTLTQLLDETDAPPGLIQPLRLPDAAATLISAVTESLGLALAAAASPPPGGPGVPLDAAGLARAERALAGADLAAFTFGQAVCRLHPDEGPLTPLWQDRRVSLPALTAAVLPGVDPEAAPALRRRLLRLTEARMLAALAHPATLTRWQPVGIALSLATLAGPAFQKLDGMLPAQARKSLVLGLEAEEILADPDGFVAAREMAASRGYRLALEEATPALLALLPPARLGLELVRLRWTPKAPREALPALPPGVEAVLMGVDRPAALAWGWERGITLFQGPLIERRRGAE